MRILKRMHGRGLVVLAVLGLAVGRHGDRAAGVGRRPAGHERLADRLRPGVRQQPEPVRGAVHLGLLRVHRGVRPAAELQGLGQLARSENSPAQSFESSPDGKVWTYKLRPGVKWADGHAVHRRRRGVDAADRDRHRRGPRQRACPATCRAVDKIEKVDDLTVKITLQEPNVRMSSLYIPILPKHIWEKADLKKIKDFDPFTEITDATTGKKKKAIIGTGPFMVTKLDKKGTTILERNPYFYGPKGEIDRILMIKYGDKDPQLRDIKLGNLDAILSGSLKWARGRGERTRTSRSGRTQPRLLRDRVRLVHRRRRLALHGHRQGRQEGRRPGSGDPARAVLRAEPRRGAEDGAAGPGHRRQRPDLAVLRQVLPGLLEGSRDRLRLRSGEGQADPRGRRLELPGGRHLRQERRQGQLRAARAPEQPGRPERHAAVRGRRQGGRHRHEALDRVRGPDQRAHLRHQPDRREQVRAHV